MIDNQLIEICNGIAFEFWDPTEEKLSDYLDLLSEFYPRKM